MKTPDSDHRCYVDPGYWDSAEIRLSPSEAHHLLHVLRAKPGVNVGIFDGRGREGVAEVVVAGSGRELLLRVHEEHRKDPPAVSFTLIQALPKGRTMDLIVEKATELGVARIIPMVTCRVIQRPDASGAAKKEERWRKIALSAARQCGSAWVPEVEDIRAYEEVVPRCGDFDLAIVGTLEEGTLPLSRILREGTEAGARTVAIAIGPEGDFAPEEVRGFSDAGMRPASFGDRVFRVETASLYVLSVLVYEFLTVSAERGGVARAAADVECGCGGKRSGSPAE